MSRLFYSPLEDLGHWQRVRHPLVSQERSELMALSALFKRNKPRPLSLRQVRSHHNAADIAGTSKTVKSCESPGQCLNVFGGAKAIGLG